MTEITTSHDPRDWREAFETTEHGPELDRIRARVAAARQRGENDALVAVVLDEASGWRERALQAEERAEELSRIAAGLTEREAAATREAKRLRLLVDGEGA